MDPNEPIDPRAEGRFIEDPATWDERWSRMPVLAREDARQEMGHGWTPREAAYAPFAYLIAQRHRRSALILLGGVLPGMILVLTVVAYLLRDGLDPSVLFVTSGLVLLLAAGFSLWLLYTGHALVERSSAVLDGMDPAEANATHPTSRWLRAAVVVGRLAFASLLMLMLVRALGVAGWAGLQAVGVEAEVSDAARRVGTALWLPTAAVLTWLVYRAVWSKDRASRT